MYNSCYYYGRCIPEVPKVSIIKQHDPGHTDLMKLIMMSSRYPTLEDTIKQILEETPDEINKQDSTGHTPLMLAFTDLNVSDNIVNILLKYGSDPNTCTSSGMNLLESLIERWDANVHDEAQIENRIKILLKSDSGFELNKLNKYGNNILMEIVEKATYTIPTNIIKLLIEAGSDIHLENKSKNTLLLLVVKSIHQATEDTVKLLLDYKADPNVINDHQYTALMRLFENNKCDIKSVEKITKLLLDAGADPNAKNNYGNTALICAASIEKCGNLMKILLDAKADPNVQNVNMDTALTKIIKNYTKWKRNTDIITPIQILLEFKADQNLCGEDGTPLMLVCAISHREKDKIVNLLLKHNADPTKGISGNTLLRKICWHACSNNGTEEDISVIKILLDEIPKESDPSLSDLLAEIYATIGSKITKTHGNIDNRLNVIKILLEYNADANLALAKACSANNPIDINFIEILFEYGADINYKVENGKTILSLAINGSSKYNNGELIGCLLKNGKVSITDIINDVYTEDLLANVKYMFQSYYKKWCIETVQMLLEYDIITNTGRKRILDYIINKIKCSYGRDTAKDDIVSSLLNTVYDLTDKELKLLEAHFSNVYNEYKEKVVLRNYLKNIGKIWLKRYIGKRQQQLFLHPESYYTLLTGYQFEIKSGVSKDVVFDKMDAKIKDYFSIFASDDIMEKN